MAAGGDGVAAGSCNRGNQRVVQAVGVSGSNVPTPCCEGVCAAAAVAGRMLLAGHPTSNRSPPSNGRSKQRVGAIEPAKRSGVDSQVWDTTRHSWSDVEAAGLSKARSPAATPTTHPRPRRIAARSPMQSPNRMPAQSAEFDPAGQSAPNRTIRGKAGAGCEVKRVASRRDAARPQSTIPRAACTTHSPPRLATPRGKFQSFDCNLHVFVLRELCD